jgi:hypothetical protein
MILPRRRRRTGGKGKIAVAKASQENNCELFEQSQPPFQQRRNGYQNQQQGDLSGSPSVAISAHQIVSDDIQPFSAAPPMYSNRGRGLGP